MAGLVLDHIGLLASELDYEAVAAYQGLSRQAAMGLVRFCVVEAYQAKVYLVGSVEIIVPLPGSLYDEHLKKLGRSSSWHHLSYRGASLEQACRVVEAEGYKPELAAPFQTPAGLAQLYRTNRQSLVEVLGPDEVVLPAPAEVGPAQEETPELLEEARAALAVPVLKRPATTRSGRVPSGEAAGQIRLTDSPIDPTAAKPKPTKKAPPFSPPKR